MFIHMYTHLYMYICISIHNTMNKSCMCMYSIYIMYTDVTMHIVHVNVHGYMDGIIGDVECMCDGVNT